MAISVIGNVNVDIVLRDVDELAEPGGERHIADAALRVGGSAGTTALALARLGLAPRLYSAVGRDAFGALITAELHDRHVAENLVVRSRTCASVGAQSPRRDRSFLTYPGVLETFCSSDVPDHAWRAELAMISGHFALPCMRRGGSRALLTAARLHNVQTLFDPGPEPDHQTSSGTSEVLALAPMIDILLPNQAEACALARTDDPIAATLALAARSGGWIVTKMGAGGAAAAHPHAGVVTLAAPPVTVIDTVGAGDCFNAGLLYGLQTGRDVAESLPFAVATASLAVSRPSHDRIPSISEVNRAAALIGAPTRR
jgi:sugar/nucleoside kinase (ribokinase family)